MPSPNEADPGVAPIRCSMARTLESALTAVNRTPQGGGHPLEPSRAGSPAKKRARLPCDRARGNLASRVEGGPMAFESVKAEIGLLLTRMQNEPEDAHEIYLQLMEKLNELKAFGMPIPDDLMKLEAALEAEF